MQTQMEQDPRPAPIPPKLVAEDARPATDAAGTTPSRNVTWRVWLSTPVLCAASVLLMVGAYELDALGAPGRIPALLALLGAGLFVLSVPVAAYRAARGVHAVVRRRLRDEPLEDGDFAFILGNLFVAGFGAFVAYLATFGFSRGRQLRRFGRVLLPGLRDGSGWTASAVDAQGFAGAPDGLAGQWRENGKTEHASVAAFARLTLDLMALGAPPRLIAAANQDALDEIRHTELCFSLARALDGRSVEPAPFPEAQRVSTLPRSRTLALAKLAVDSLVDGALHEGVSARIISRLSRRCEVPAIRAALREIASDEGRHAAHGWWVVDWCLEEGGRPVQEALLGALGALPKQMRSELPQAARDGGWERWGIHGHALESEEYAAALAQVVERTRTRIAEYSRTAA